MRRVLERWRSEKYNISYIVPRAKILRAFNKLQKGSYARGGV
jgi:hypothetical protein